jgi:hypothetical protein
MKNTQYSLLSKFEGALVGLSAAQQARLSQTNAVDVLRSTFKNYVLLTGASIESIIHCRAVNLADWQLATNRLISDDQIMVAILPIALYLHEDIPRLQATIQEIGNFYKLDSETMASMTFLVMGIAYLLTERCSTSDFIPQILAESLSADTLVYQQLQLIQNQVILNPVPSNITQLIGKITLANQPYLMPIAMATYCFLCNPTSLRLATRRAAHIPQQPPLTLALTGMLVGAAQGLSSIPPSWCISDGSVTELLIQLSDRLLAVWAGVYPTAMGIEHHQAIAAPNVLQKR